ncbi:MAG: M23 family metallopeptidase [candidate division SR1 bacterium]|nr:M23 family metallopeptidase [candidate division SR1 bacterium]
MKTKFFILLAIVLLFALASCQKDQNTNPSAPASQGAMVNSDAGNPQLKAALTEFVVSPKFGKPNSTYYNFKVADIGGALPLSVKLYERVTGAITYLPMVRVGTNWTLSTKITINGWYDYRYVYTSNKANISGTNYPLCNTNNVFSSSGTSAITWPFGADGSSWGNRLGWIAANEIGGCGNAWNVANQHCYFSCGADDSYAIDWNKNCSSAYADDGATVRSPLDGTVVKVFTDSPQNHNSGYGNAVDIQQEGSDGQFYVFRVAHLKYAPSVGFGACVRAGVTAIGNIGMTGGTSTAPHAHCALYNATSGCNAKTKFTFNAQ